MTPTERAALARRHRTHTPPSRYTYRRQWPVLDDGLTLQELAAEALDDLRAAIAAAGAHQTGPPKWDITTGDNDSPLLVAEVPCVLGAGAAREVNDDAVAHLLDEGVPVARIAAMLRVPRDLVEDAALRCRHRANVDPDLARELDLDGAGLGNDSRMWSDRPPPRHDLCGTESGYTKHRRLGERPCADCKAAHAAATAVRKARAKAMREAS